MYAPLLSALTRQGIWLPLSQEDLEVFLGPPVKRVRVTPGLQRRFTRLYPGFTYRQWPGFTPRTHPFGLAGSYVFIKQSGPPSHCGPRFHGFSAEPQAPLIPKLRG